jgi:hypothetical protein
VTIWNSLWNSLTLYIDYIISTWGF